MQPARLNIENLREMSQMILTKVAKEQPKECTVNAEPLAKLCLSGKTPLFVLAALFAKRVEPTIKGVKVFHSDAYPITYCGNLTQFSFENNEWILRLCTQSVRCARDWYVRQASKEQLQTLSNELRSIGGLERLEMPRLAIEGADSEIYPYMDDIFANLTHFDVSIMDLLRYPNAEFPRLEHLLLFVSNFTPSFEALPENVLSQILPGRFPEVSTFTLESTKTKFEEVLSSVTQDSLPKLKHLKLNLQHPFNVDFVNSLKKLVAKLPLLESVKIELRSEEAMCNDTPFNVDNHEAAVEAFMEAEFGVKIELVCTTRYRGIYKDESALRNGGYHEYITDSCQTCDSKGYNYRNGRPWNMHCSMPSKYLSETVYFDRNYA